MLNVRVCVYTDWASIGTEVHPDYQSALIRYSCHLDRARLMFTCLLLLPWSLLGLLGLVVVVVGY